jgi:hypothetical protein
MCEPRNHNANFVSIQKCLYEYIGQNNLCNSKSENFYSDSDGEEIDVFS